MQRLQNSMQLFISRWIRSTHLSTQNVTPPPLSVVGNLKSTKSKRTWQEKRRTRRAKQVGEYRTEVARNPDYEAGMEQLEYEVVKDSHGQMVKGQLSESFCKERVRLKRIILMKKYFPQTPQLSLLTYRAREQLRHLRTTEPDVWNPDTLSSAFPISAQGVQRLLHGNFRLFSLREMYEYNEKIMDRWSYLLNCLHRNVELPPGLLWVVQQGKLNLLPYADGNPTLPQQAKTSLEARLEAEASRSAGPLESLVKDFYADRVAKRREREMRSVAELIRGQKRQIDDFLSAMRGDKIQRPSERSEVNDPIPKSPDQSPPDSDCSIRRSTTMLDLVRASYRAPVPKSCDAADSRPASPVSSVHESQGPPSTNKKPPLVLPNKVKLNFAQHFTFASDTDPEHLQDNKN